MVSFYENIWYKPILSAMISNKGKERQPRGKRNQNETKNG